MLKIFRWSYTLYIIKNREQRTENRTAISPLQCQTDHVQIRINVKQKSLHIRRMLNKDRIYVIRTLNSSRSKSNCMTRREAPTSYKLSSTCTRDWTTSVHRLRYLFETKTRTIIQTRFEFSRLISVHCRYKDTLIRFAQICVRVLLDYWRVFARLTLHNS